MSQTSSRGIHTATKYTAAAVHLNGVLEGKEKAASVTALHSIITLFTWTIEGASGEMGTVSLCAVDITRNVLGAMGRDMDDRSVRAFAEDQQQLVKQMYHKGRFLGSEAERLTLSCFLTELARQGEMARGPWL